MSHFVYRIASTAGELLYVGQTKNVEQRLEQHRRWAPWARGAWVTFEEFPTREAALLREREVIEQEHPVHNVRFNTPTPHADWVTLSVRVTQAMADDFKAVCAGEFRSMAAELRRLIQERIDEADKHDSEVAA